MSLVQGAPVPDGGRLWQHRVGSTGPRMAQLGLTLPPSPSEGRWCHPEPALCGDAGIGTQGTALPPALCPAPVPPSWALLLPPGPFSQPIALANFIFLALHTEELGPEAKPRAHS